MRADVWIGSLAILPLRCPVPAVAMVHDLTPRTHPNRHTLSNRLVFGVFLERFSAVWRHGGRRIGGDQRRGPGHVSLGRIQARAHRLRRR